jgi:hypothetical protein
MNWKLRFVLWFVNNVQPLRGVEIKNIEKERKNSIKCFKAWENIYSTVNMK